MIIAMDLRTGKVRKFPDVEAANKFYKGISVQWIIRCIQTGQRYKGIVFDEVEDEKKQVP